MRPQALDGRLVLLVDDGPLVLHLVARLLTEAGYVVLLAGDGEEGLAVTATLGDKLGLVVTDIRMPVLDGFTMAARLRDAKPDLPLLFISGFAPVGGRESLPGPMLNKPFTSDALLTHVRGLLSTSDAAIKPA